MPHSVSLPFSAFLETHSVPEHIASKLTDNLPMTYTRLKSNQGIIAALEESLGAARAKEVLEGKRQVVTSCGSGMTAGILWLGLKLLGVERVGLYDEVRRSYTHGLLHLLIIICSRGQAMQCAQRARLRNRSKLAHDGHVTWTWGT